MGGDGDGVRDVEEGFGGEDNNLICHSCSILILLFPFLLFYINEQKITQHLHPPIPHLL